LGLSFEIDDKLVVRQPRSRALFASVVVVEKLGEKVNPSNDVPP
jgi:hypothetical protein